MRLGLIDGVKHIVTEEGEAALINNPLFNSTHEGYAVILEEVDEAKEAMTQVEQQCSRLWHNVKNNYFSVREHSFVELGYLEQVAINLACEAIQVAAMARKFRDSIKP